MRNPEIEKIFEEKDNGTLTSVTEANERLEDAKAGYHLDPWKNFIGRNEYGVGLMDTGTGTLDKVKVIEAENGIRLENPAFNPESFKDTKPVVMVQYGEVWFKVEDDGVTMTQM